MILDNIPQSILYPAYRKDIGASEQIRSIKKCQERWRKLFDGYEREIGRFKDNLNGVTLCNKDFLDRLERNYLNRIFGCVTNLFGEVDAGEIYNEMMALYAGRYDLNHLFDRLKTLFGIRLSVVSASDFRYNEKVVGIERDEIATLLEMLLPADVYVKVSYAAKSGLGIDFRLGKGVLESGFFVL